MKGCEIGLGKGRPRTSINNPVVRIRGAVRVLGHFAAMSLGRAAIAERHSSLAVPRTIMSDCRSGYVRNGWNIVGLPQSIVGLRYRADDELAYDPATWRSFGPLAGDACRAAPCRTPVAPIDSCNTNCTARMTNAGLRLVNRQYNA